MSLIEILVASALFGMFTGMVAGALIMAQRTQDASVTKLDAVRRATVCLGLLVRDVQSALYISDVTMNGTDVPTTPTTPVGVDELQIKRQRQYPGGGDPTWTEEIIVGYWFDEGSGEEGEGMVRRVLYDSYTMDPLTGEPEDGRILIRDVKDFKVSKYALGGVNFIKAEIWVTTIGNPISSSVALVPTTAP